MHQVTPDVMKLSFKECRMGCRNEMGQYLPFIVGTFVPFLKISPVSVTRRPMSPVKFTRYHGNQIAGTSDKEAQATSGVKYKVSKSSHDEAKALGAA